MLKLGLFRTSLKPYGTQRLWHRSIPSSSRLKTTAGTEAWPLILPPATPLCWLELLDCVRYTKDTIWFLHWHFGCCKNLPIYIFFGVLLQCTFWFSQQPLPPSPPPPPSKKGHSFLLRIFDHNIKACSLIFLSFTLTQGPRFISCFDWLPVRIGVWVGYQTEILLLFFLLLLCCLFVCLSGFYSKQQQGKMACYCTDIFGEMLLTKPLEGYPVCAFRCQGYCGSLSRVPSESLCFSQLAPQVAIIFMELRKLKSQLFKPPNWERGCKPSWFLPSFRVKLPEGIWSWFLDYVKVS